MPALPLVPATFSIRSIFTLGSDATTGWHIYLNSGGPNPTAAQIQQMASEWSITYGSHWQQLAAGSCTLTEVIVTNLGDPTAPQGIWQGSIPGTRTGAAGLPANAAMVLSFGIGRRYRGGKPRAYTIAGLS